jgi:D-beta-D-heptose 7-phosphate kinase/D-beta-D-heptose 1-phosphate adenosyltransferase
VIVATDELAGLRGRVAMTDGGFDPLHAGHVAYLAAAAALGAPVLCNVSGDHWVGRKHPPLLPEQERVVVVDAIRHVTYTHLSRTSTEAILDALRPRYYVKGQDWRDRLPPAQVDLCARHGIEIVFVDTVRNSSTRLLETYLRATQGTTT